METRSRKQTQERIPASSWKRIARFRNSNSRKNETLTRRERQVLGRLAAGKMYKEISDELGVALDTVRFHCKGIYKKLGVRSRTEAVLWLLREERRKNQKLPKDAGRQKEKPWKTHRRSAVEGLNGKHNSKT